MQIVLPRFGGLAEPRLNEVLGHLEELQSNAGANMDGVARPLLQLFFVCDIVCLCCCVF